MDVFIVKRIYQPKPVEGWRSLFTKLGTKAILIIDSKHYVLSEAYPVDTQHEFLLFKSDDNGNITNWMDLWVKKTGTFGQAISDLGKQVRDGWRPLNESKNNS